MRPRNELAPLPKLPLLIGLAKLTTGDTSEGNAELAAAKKLEPNIVEDFIRYGVR